MEGSYESIASRRQIPALHSIGEVLVTTIGHRRYVAVLLPLDKSFKID